MMCIEVVYQGRVQGVGFRATCRDAARGFRVSGWVRNEPDGSVRLVAQGEPAEVHGLMEEIRRRMGRFITGETAQDGPRDGALVGFEIRR